MWRLRTPTDVLITVPGSLATSARRKSLSLVGLTKQCLARSSLAASPLSYVLIWGCVYVPIICQRINSGNLEATEPSDERTGPDSEYMRFRRATRQWMAESPESKPLTRFFAREIVLAKGEAAIHENPIQENPMNASDLRPDKPALNSDAVMLFQFCQKLRTEAEKGREFWHVWVHERIGLGLVHCDGHFRPDRYLRKGTMLCQGAIV